MSRKRIPKKKRRRRILLIILAVVLLIVCAAVGTVLISRYTGRLKFFHSGDKPNLPSITDTAEPEDTGETAETKKKLPSDADVYYGGKAYNYNTNLLNILFIGVDKNFESDGLQHQADSLYLAVYDEAAKEYDIVAISRGTMSTIDIYNTSGVAYTRAEVQICLAYGYGMYDDVRCSELQVKAVSELLYGLPINGYFTLFMDEVGGLVDAVGGVPVTVNEDLTESSPLFTEGAQLTLNGDTAMKYLRARNNSNSGRLLRQVDFIKSYLSQLLNGTKSNPTLPFTLYNKVSERSVTNISADSAVYLISELLNAKMGEVSNLVGEIGIFNEREAVYLDDDELYKFIINTFYVEYN